MTVPSIKRKVASLIDRPGGRSILAATTTQWARSATGDHNIAVTYDDMWIDVVDGKFIPRSQKFGYFAHDIKRLRERATSRLSGSIDYWAHIYKPRIGDTIIDIGAGVGIDVIAFSPLVGTAGHIYSIEAHPWTFRALMKTKQLNNLANVSAFHVAISDGPGVIWITDLPEDEENSISPTPANGYAIKVPSIDLDSFVERNSIGRINLLKMNIEGAEELAIRGMSKCIHSVEHVVIACHDFRGDLSGTKKPVIDFLKGNGFQIISREDDPRSYVRDHIHGKRLCPT